MSNGARAGIGVAAIALVVVLFILLKGGDDDDSTTTAAPQTTTAVTTTDDSGTGAEEPADEPAEKPPAEPDVAVIEVKDGQPVGGVQELSFDKGDDIRFIVESDVDEEVHFHGYDVAQDVSAGGKVEFDVPATLEGVFEVELEHSVVPIAEITVNP